MDQTNRQKLPRYLGLLRMQRSEAMLAGNLAGKLRTSTARLLFTVVPALVSGLRSKSAPGSAGYDRAFARVSTHFVPFLLRAAHIAPGMRVLCIAAGTGLAAEAASSARLGTSLPLTSRRQWSRRHVRASAKQTTFRLGSKTGKRCHSRKFRCRRV